MTAQFQSAAERKKKRHIKHGAERGKLKYRCRIQAVFKRNANAFSLNAIVDRRSRRRRHEMICFLISRKLLELAISKFTTTQALIAFTFRPEITS